MNMTSFRTIQRARAGGDRRAYFTSERAAEAFARIARATGIQRTCNLTGWVVYFK